MKMSSHHATATTIHRIKTESTIICLPFHPKSHRKLPETLTPDVPLTHILRAKTTDQKKINLHECTCIRRVWCANDRSHITATGCTVHVIAHTLTHTHAKVDALPHTRIRHAQWHIHFPHNRTNTRATTDKADDNGKHVSRRYGEPMILSATPTKCNSNELNNCADYVQHKVCWNLRVKQMEQ